MHNITRHNPAGLFDSSSAGFSQVSVRETSTERIIAVSGQVAWNEQREVVGAGDLRVQVVESLRNIEKALKSAGASLTDVMALRIYILESHITDTAAVTDGLIEVFGDNLPCTTWIGVPSLASKDFLVEIEPDQVVIPRERG